MQGTYGPPQGSCHVVLEVTDGSTQPCCGRWSHAPPVGCWNPVPLRLAPAVPLQPHCSDLPLPSKGWPEVQRVTGVFQDKTWLAC